jgi:hypothetical protein
MLNKILYLMYFEAVELRQGALVRIRFKYSIDFSNLSHGKVDYFIPR